MYFIVKCLMYLNVLVYVLNVLMLKYLLRSTLHYHQIILVDCTLHYYQIIELLVVVIYSHLELLTTNAEA